MQRYTFYEHFYELKQRFIKIFIFFLLTCFICYCFSNEIYRIILNPLIDAIGEKGRKVIFTGLTEAFFSYIKISIFTSMILTFPVCCYQIYAFIKPGLNRNEKSIISVTLALSPLLFYIGILFMFYIVMPNAWLFFISYENTNIGLPLVLEAKISEYITLVVQLTLAFGICFQLPIAVIILSAMGLITAELLRKKRRIAIVAIFIVAAIFTPPDVFSQIALAVPLLLLYEVSVWLCLAIEKKRVD
ncbi:MAG: twin-arginine translocase subunit TatC [Rickettsiaceae bacterium]